MADQTMTAFCFGNGLIQIAPHTPERAFELASAPGTLLAQTIDAISDLSNDNQNYLVPGVKEAPDEAAAMDCVFDFQTQLNARLARCLASTGVS